MAVIFGVGITVCLLVVDLAVKYKVERDWKQGEERPAAGGRLKLRKVHNKGMCLNLLDQYPMLVKWSSLILSACLSFYQLFLYRKKGNKMRKAGVIWMLAGAWSNTIDRWLRGYVVDYIGIQTKKEELSRITYNLGDFFIAVGAVLLVISNVFHRDN